MVNGPIKGRGAITNRASRFDTTVREPDEAAESGSGIEVPRTEVTEEYARSIVSKNRSPDIPFDRSINPYRGCEHGCIYCYARPTHAYLGLSPGLDFETQLVVKRNAAEQLSTELGRKGYRCEPIALGANTDPYQPVERIHRVTREILEVLHDCRHPITITTKSALIERDLDLLVAMAERRLVEVQISITTLDGQLARVMEPRATAPARRLETVRTLADAGVPVRLMVAPLIPFVNDADLENLVTEGARHGAQSAGYIVLRLPLEIKDLFREWLEAHFPLRAHRVLACVTELHDGQLYNPQFGKRQTGTGIFADLLRQRFAIALRKSGMRCELPPLDSSLFRPPRRHAAQLDLFAEDD
ncbi:PA0069 family radical SAM protein [Methylolobus aquaticus]